MMKQQKIERPRPRPNVRSGLRPTLISLAIVQSLSLPMTQAATIDVTNFGDTYFEGIDCQFKPAVCGARVQLQRRFWGQ